MMIIMLYDQWKIAGFVLNSCTLNKQICNLGKNLTTLLIDMLDSHNLGRISLKFSLTLFKTCAKSKLRSYRSILVFVTNVLAHESISMHVCWFNAYQNFKLIF